MKGFKNVRAERAALNEPQTMADKETKEIKDVLVGVGDSIFTKMIDLLTSINEGINKQDDEQASVPADENDNQADTTKASESTGGDNSTSSGGDNSGDGSKNQVYYLE